MKIIIRILAVLIMFGGVFATYIQARQANSLAFWGEVFPVLGFVLTSLILFLGIVFGSVFRSISRSKKKVRIAAELTAVFEAPSFWTAVCVSPFVLFSVYAVVSRSPGDPASYLLAFQNGFFCEAVFRQLMGIQEEKGGAGDGLVGSRKPGVPAPAAAGIPEEQPPPIGTKESGVSPITPATNDSISPPVPKRVKNKKSV